MLTTSTTPALIVSLSCWAPLAAQALARPPSHIEHAGGCKPRSRREWCIARSLLLGWQSRGRHNTRRAQGNLGARLGVSVRSGETAGRRSLDHQALDRQRCAPRKADSPGRPVQARSGRGRSLCRGTAAGSPQDREGGPRAAEGQLADTRRATSRPTTRNRRAYALAGRARRLQKGRFCWTS